MDRTQRESAALADFWSECRVPRVGALLDDICRELNTLCAELISHGLNAHMLRRTAQSSRRQRVEIMRFSWRVDRMARLVDDASDTVSSEIFDIWQFALRNLDDRLESAANEWIADRARIIRSEVALDVLVRMSDEWLATEKGKRIARMVWRGHDSGFPLDFTDEGELLYRAFDRWGLDVSE